MTRSRPSCLALPLLATLLLTGCSSLYYATMEKFGVEKRQILASRVEEGRDEQEQAKQQFQTTLEAFKAVTNFDGGDLESTYNRLSEELEDCEAQADDVRGRIESIEKVAADLFAEWKEENEAYTSAELRSKSQAMLRDTESRYGQLIKAMRRAEGKMEPVLSAFRDQVLFLKHNLNAQAISSLQDNVVEIENDIAVLVQDMEASIAEANSFIETLG